MTRATAEKTAKRYSKEQLMRSERYSKQRDLLGALLEDDKQYAFDEVDAKIKTFNTKEVK